MSRGSLAPIDATEPTPGPIASTSLAFTEELFKLFMQTYMDTIKIQAPALVQAPASPVLVEPKEQPLKARFPDLYFGKLYLDCYWFCQQFEDHFDTARANGKNRTPFAASFLWDGISTCWTQYKRRHAQEKGPDVVIPWEEFKAFLRENCGNSRTFVKGIWNRFRGDSQYQLEDAQDWASHLEHLQSILQEFDPESAPEELDLIRFFQDGLQSSIQAEMESSEEEYKSWEVLIRKATAAEEKTRGRPASQIKEVDQYCPRGHRPSLQANKHQQEKGQGQSQIKHLRQQEPKPSC